MLSVVIGRFQTPHLTHGHKTILKDADLVLIGTTAAINNKNPLDYRARLNMILSYSPNKFPIIDEIPDFPSDSDWSKMVDTIIHHHNVHGEEVLLLGGRDHSLDAYCGEHKVKIIEDTGGKSGTQARAQITITDYKGEDAFRAGMIHQQNRQYPTVYSTVDVVLYNNECQLLVGKKGDKFAFVGGFVDPSDANLKSAAIRELYEETGIELDSNSNKITYFDSMKIEDDRYKGTKDSIMTHIFTGLQEELPDYDNIKDKEFSEFRFISESELDLLQDCHRPIAIKFFNLIRK